MSLPRYVLVRQGGAVVLVTEEDAAALERDQLMCGNAYVRQTGQAVEVHGLQVYERIPPGAVRVRP